MARSVTVIQQQIITNLVSTSAAVGVTIDPTIWSQFDYRQLFTWVVAVAIATFEQIMDAFQIDLEAIGATFPPQTPAWFQNMSLNIFEYDATAVPIVQLNTADNFAPFYPDPNPAFRIIKYSSVVPGALGTTTLKAAKQVSGAPAALSGTELDAYQSFINIIGVPGITYNAVSLDSDKLYVQAQIYYSGLYSAIISANVIAAMNNYLATIPFNGYVTLSDLEAAIKAVPGVLDVVFNNVSARADTTSFGSGTPLVQSNTLIQRNWQTVAGYIIGETTGGQTFADTLIFIPQ